MAAGDVEQGAAHRQAALTARPITGVITAGERILLDTSALIAYLGDLEPASRVAAAVMDGCVRSGRNPAIVSTVTAMELLVRPMRLADERHHQQLVDFLVQFPNLMLRDVSFATVHAAAALRAAYRLGAADALIVATGIQAGATEFVCNDRDWVARLAPIGHRVRVRYLEDHSAR